MDEGAVEADRAPAGVGHLGLVPEARKFKMSRARYWANIMSSWKHVTRYTLLLAPRLDKNSSYL